MRQPAAAPAPRLPRSTVRRRALTAPRRAAPRVIALLLAAASMAAQAAASRPGLATSRIAGRPEPRAASARAGEAAPSQDLAGRPGNPARHGAAGNAALAAPVHAGVLAVRGPNLLEDARQTLWAAWLRQLLGLRGRPAAFWGGWAGSTGPAGAGTAGLNPCLNLPTQTDCGPDRDPNGLCCPRS